MIHRFPASAPLSSRRRPGAFLSRLPLGSHCVALTFDDGPSNETSRFLAILERWNVPATFFLCGRNVERRPETARMIVQAGHAVGNHTFSHRHLLFRTPARVRAEVARTQDSIQRATGRLPGHFRAPYGLRSRALRRVLPEFGLQGVHWSVIGRDWTLDAPRIAARVLRRVADGSIICLHDGDRVRPEADRTATLEALATLIPGLREQGYRFALLPGWEA